LAEDVSQNVFVALEQNAEHLAVRETVCGWLHRTTHNLSANVVRSEVRRRAREEEAAAMNELLSPEPTGDWESIVPELDAALNLLSEPDRDAVLLRYFQHKSAREMAQLLGISGEAAQKRVNRALERLRGLFAQRGIAVGASGLVVLLSANAVQAAPVSLSAAISTATLSSAALHASTTLITRKVLIMTTLQKVLIGAAVVASIGTGGYQYTQNIALREKVHTLAEQMQKQRVGNELAGSRVVAEGSDTVLPSPPAGSRPATAPRRVAGSKKAFQPKGFQETELFAFLTNVQAQLTLAQVTPYLDAHGRNASSLLAAFRAVRDPALLAEAMQKYPNEPQVGFEAATRVSASPEERRAGLDAFKKAAPDNALANYLSALDFFKTDHKAEAVQELNAAAGKTQFSDYTEERVRNNQELYLAAGYAPGQAQMIANWFLPEAQLTQVRELGQNLADLAVSYRQAGDQSASQLALQMGLDLGKRFDDPSTGQAMRWQLIGIRVERANLGAMAPTDTVPGTTESVQERLGQLSDQMQSIQALTQKADSIWKTLSDNDWADYHRQITALGEEGAVRWLVNNHAQH